MRTFMAAALVVAWIPMVAMGQAVAQPAERREVTAPTPLLDANGSLEAWGWAKRAIIEYNRSAIPAKRHARIKEWEHYTIMSPEFTIGVTIVQLGPLVSGSAELIDYKAG